MEFIGDNDVIPQKKSEETSAAFEAALGKVIVGHAGQVLSQYPEGSIDLIVTSPPYWTAVEYEGQKNPWATYEDYLSDIMTVWAQCARVLRPNGKLCINTPIMPIPKDIIQQHTRHLKNIAFDFEHMILRDTDLLRYSLFIWQKQTSKLMFGSYPFPGNILENNTIEFINVYVKPGKPPKFETSVKEANKLLQPEWVDLAQQIWFMYPEDVKREGDHPAPFPEKLPGRLMRMYTYGRTDTFPGEIILDPFCGTGTACAVAKRMGRQFIGIDISPRYAEMAEERIAAARYGDRPVLLVGRPKFAGKDELIGLDAALATGNAGQAAETKHKRETYGRAVPKKEQLDFAFKEPDELFEVESDGEGPSNT